MKQQSPSSQTNYVPVEEIAQAIVTQLSQDSALTKAGLTIQHAEPINRDISLTPWLGIYPGRLQLKPHTLGGSKLWQSQLEMLLYLQDSSHKSSQDASKRLYKIQNLLLSALYSNLLLSGVLLAMEEMEISPFQRDINADTWLFTNEIALQTIPC